MLKRRQLIAIALLALLVSGIAWLEVRESQISSPVDHHKNGQQVGKRGANYTYIDGIWEWAAHDAITVYTLFLAIFTAVLSCTAIIQIRYLRRADETSRAAADAAKGSADVAKSTLVASQRAWIRIDRANISQPLTFNEQGASTAISFKLTNIGNSPALNVMPHAWLFVLREGHDPLAEQQRRCNELKAQLFQLGFSTIFPNETFPDNVRFGWSFGLNVPKADIDEFRKRNPDGKYLSLYVLGCIDYTFPTDRTVHHQTRFVFQVQKRSPAPISPDEGPIPAADLELFNFVIGKAHEAD